MQVIHSYQQGIQIFHLQNTFFFLRKLSLVLSGSLLLNDAVCPSYLFINLVNDILDMVSYNRDKFILPVTIVSKEIMKTSVLDLGKPSLKATDWWRSAQLMLWFQDLSEFSDSFSENCPQNKLYKSTYLKSSVMNKSSLWVLLLVINT